MRATVVAVAKVAKARVVTTATLAILSASPLWGAGCSGAESAVSDAGAVSDTAPPTSCTTATVCDGRTTLRACRGGVVAEVIEQCGAGFACSRGRCTTLACADVETRPDTFLGCRFYTLPIDNVVTDEGAMSSVLVTNPSQTEASVALEQRTRSDWTAVRTATVAALQSQRIVLPARIFEGGGYGQHAALRLTSDVPVSAVHVQSDDTGETSTNSGGALLLPVQALGNRYTAITYAQEDVPKLDAIAGSRGGAGQVIIVGTEDRTNVTFQVSATASLGLAGGAPPRGPGESFDLVLDEGDFYQIFSVADGDDLTGSRITADRPVAVLSGNISTTYGRQAPGINTPDMAHEQLLPESSWGLRYVAAALPPQPDLCDGVLGAPDASLWRIVASHDGTTVEFDAPPGVTGVPPLDQSVVLPAGGVHEVVVSGGSFTVNASAPVQVLQGMDCEPTMSPAVSAMPLLTDLRFAVLPNFDQLVSIVRPAGVPVMLDEGPVADARFRPAGGGFEVAQVMLSTCPAMASVCTHHLAGQFGVSLRGMDVVCSYALTMSTWVTCSDMTSPGCVP